MNNTLISVDIFDNPLGIISKEEAHKKGILHRAFSVFVYHSGRMLIQKRAKNKYHSGGLLSNTCCSHPRGQNLIEEASDRLFEETGVRAKNLKEIFSFTYFTKFSEELFEYEYDHVLICDYEGAFFPNKDEVEELKWITFNELKKEVLSHPQKFTTWFLIALPKVLEYIQQNEQKDM